MLFFKKNNIKPNRLNVSIGKMVKSPSKEDFLNDVKILKRNGCKKLENIYFSKADVYDNDGLCYVFNAKLSQRLSRRTGIAVSANSVKYDILEGMRSVYDGNIFFVNFSSSWGEKKAKSGYIKGLGNYKYNSWGGLKNVPKGKVLKFF